MAFSEKQINVQFSLASGQFAGGGNSASITELRVALQIDATAGTSQSTMAVAIYGMPLDMMQQLATVGPQWNQRYQNGIDVFAGDAGATSLVFSGVVFNAFVDGQAMPDLCLRVLAAPGSFEAVKPMTPVSIKGSADAAGLMSQLAGQMGLSFQNNGVSVKLANPYYAGSAWESALEIAAHGNFDVVVERKTMIISPRGNPLTAEPVLISAAAGNMVGYPGFVQNGVVIRALFDPAVKLLSQIKVESELKPASGTWQVIKIDYDLESQTPGGNWFMTLQGIPMGTQ